MNNIKLTDYVDALNDAASKLKKYEGFYPDRYLIVDDGSEFLTLKIIPTSNVEVSVPNYELKINKNLSFDEIWFKHASESQIAVYESVLDVMEKLNEKENIFKLQDDKLVVDNKKAYKSAQVQSQLELIELNAFRVLSKFRNYSIVDLVSAKSKETLESIRHKINSIIRAISDSSARLEYFDKAPNFVIDATTGLEQQSIKVTFDNEEIYNEEIDWKTASKDAVYVMLVKLCYIAKSVLNTLDFYREIVGINEPKCFVSKLFGKKWRITPVGDQYLTCLELTMLIKDVYKLEK